MILTCLICCVLCGPIWPMFCAFVGPRVSKNLICELSKGCCWDIWSALVHEGVRSSSNSRDDRLGKAKRLSQRLTRCRCSLAIHPAAPSEPLLFTRGERLGWVWGSIAFYEDPNSRGRIQSIEQVFAHVNMRDTVRNDLPAPLRQQERKIPWSRGDLHPRQA